MLCLVAYVAKLTFQNCNLRILGIRGTQCIAAVTDRNSFRREIRDEIRPEAGRDVMLSRRRDYFPKNLLAFSARGRRSMRDETFEFPRKVGPVCLSKVNKRALRACNVGKVVLVERIDEGDEDREVIRIQGVGGEGAVEDVGNGPREVREEVRGGEGDVRGGGGAGGGNPGGEVEVEEREIASFNGVNEQIAAGVIRGREPTVTVGVEIAHNDSITIRMVEQRSEVWSEVWSAGRDWR